jgi:hypothetical protein
MIGRRIVFVFLLVCSFVALGSLSAQQKHASRIGWISDEGCGAKHTKAGGADCVQKCWRGGASVPECMRSIVSELYAESSHESSNPRPKAGCRKRMVRGSQSKEKFTTTRSRPDFFKIAKYRCPDLCRERILLNLP